MKMQINYLSNVKISIDEIFNYYYCFKVILVGIFTIIIYLTFILLTSINVLASEYITNIAIPEDVVEFKGHYYKLYELNISWEDAQKYFESIGGHLATITSQEENDFIYDYIISLEHESAYFGATDKKNEGIWVWVTNEEFTYSNWHNNEPNNEQGSEDYAMFYYKYPDGTWNDGGMSTVNAYLCDTPYICEWDNNNSNNINLNRQNNSTNAINQNENNNVKKIIIEININNFSLLGGLSLLGGISFIGFVLKWKSNDDDEN